MAGRSPNNHTSKTFETFPKFSKLTLADRREYEVLIREYPPIADISFAGLMIWWDHLNTCAIALLNNNLVISYWFPGSEELSGISLVGTNKIDESLCTVFDYLRERNMPLQLVHIPEFVIEHVEYPEMFICNEDRGLSEYIFDLSKFYPLNQLVDYRRYRVKAFLHRTSEERVIFRPIDLTKTENQRMLLDYAWPRKGINRIAESFDEAWEYSILNADKLGLENSCLFIDGILRAYCIYERPADKRYVLFKHAKVDYAIYRLFDYFVYRIAQHLTEQGVMYVNLDSDMGLQVLRMLLVTLGPSNYFRKYTVRPSVK